MWEPISIKELSIDIQNSEQLLSHGLLKFWNLIKILPAKWVELEYGLEGGGFWAVGILGNHVLWFNDIEEGFNVSAYSIYGRIDQYQCEQDELHVCLYKLYNGNNF